jgi:DNA-binding transcriptional MerR regulator
MARYEEFLKKYAANVGESGLIPPNEFPDIELYPDQAADFLASKLANYDFASEISKSKINSFVRKGLVEQPENKRFSKEQLLTLEFIFYLLEAYKTSDVEQLMKPFVENKESLLDESVDFFAPYAKLLSLLNNQGAEAASHTSKTAESIKKISREEGMDDDDTLELFFVILAIAIQAEAAMTVGRALLKEYFGEEKTPKPEKPIKTPKSPKQSKKLPKEKE